MTLVLPVTATLVLTTELTDAESTEKIVDIDITDLPFTEVATLLEDDSPELDLLVTDDSDTHTLDTAPEPPTRARIELPGPVPAPWPPPTIVTLLAPVAAAFTTTWPLTRCRSALTAADRLLRRDKTVADATLATELAEAPLTLIDSADSDCHLLD